MNTATPDDAIALLSDVNDTDGADLTFGPVVQRIREASASITIHMFVWRSDEIGNRIGREILDAANRGVKIRIKKDTGAFMYERIEMNRKSFFNKPIAAPTRLMYKIRSLTFPDSHVEDEYGYELGDQIMAHDKITIDWVDHTHTKYYIFDERVMITGSINIEDRHRGYRDYMVEICGEEHIERFRSRSTNAVPYAPDRPLDFVPNSVIGGKKQFEIKQTMLDLLSQANNTVYIEMAYIGDPDISRKIVEISNRGVRVTMLFSKEANIGNDVNYRSLFRICKQADITVYFSHKMVHSKLMLLDDEIVILGSANISIFSMQKAVELDVTVKDNPPFVEAVKKTIDQRVSEGTKVESIAELANYSRVLAALQQLHQKLH